MEKKSSAKKYLFIIVVIVLAIWIIFKYLNYTRFEAPVDYSFKLNEEIDINYHDQLIVQQYFKNVYEIGSFANEQWYNYNIDVSFPDHEVAQSVLASKTYNLMKANTKRLELILTNSLKLKEQGFDNNAIKFMEKSGISPRDYNLKSRFHRVEIAINDRGKDVEILQEKLVELGYQIQVDGVFKIYTEKSIIDFQTKNKLFPSGVADQQTLKLLFKEYE